MNLNLTERQPYVEPRRPGHRKDPSFRQGLSRNQDGDILFPAPIGRHSYDVESNEHEQYEQPIRRPMNNSTWNANRFVLPNIDKWRESFSGKPEGISIEEFIFRVETLAESGGIPLSKLATGIHLLLSAKAKSWYWLYRRKNLSTSLYPLREAMRREFWLQKTDFEIRKEIEARKQGAKEPFSDYCINIEQLVSKMRNPVEEDELIEMLRRNMNSRLQNFLLLHHVYSAEVTRALLEI